MRIALSCRTGVGLVFVVLLGASFPLALPAQEGEAGLPDAGQERFDALQEEALAAQEAGDTREALEFYDLMQEMAPDDADIAYNRASLHLDLRQYQQAVTVFQRAEELGLDSAELHYNRGNALYGAGELSEAIAAYELALERSPEDPDILNNLGIAHRAAGDTDTAREYLERAAAADTAWEVPFFHLGNLHLDAGEPGDAVVAFSEALERNAAFDQAQYNRGIANYQRGAFLDAYNDFRAVRELRPDDADVLYNLGASAVAAAEEMIRSGETRSAGAATDSDGQSTSGTTSDGTAAGETE